MLLLGDLGLALMLVVGALVLRHRHRVGGQDSLGDVASVVLASVGLAVLLVEGLLPGFWIIGGYALHGGALEDWLLPGATVGSLLRALAIGLVISTYASARAYFLLLRPSRTRRGRRSPPPLTR